jgi:nicotinamidase-related amidase
MTAFPDRPNRALLVIDVQNDVVGQAYERDRVVANIRTLVADARAAAVPVVWVQHTEPQMPVGSDGWQVVPELAPDAGEPRVDKRFRSSFEGTQLEDVLAGLGVGSIVMCGAETNFCIRHTLHSALERGYDVTLVADAHTALDSDWEDPPVPAAHIIEEQNRSCRDYDLPGRHCDLTTTAAAFAPPASA